MTASRTPSYELTRRVITLLDADDDLRTLLFPDWSPPTNDPGDLRIFASHQKFKEENLAGIMPRLLIETYMETSNDWEQEDASLSCPVVLWTHILVPYDKRDHGELIDVYVRKLLVSTILSNARIIAAMLVQTGRAVQRTVPKFDDAWHIATPYLSARVGVLV